MKKALIKLGFAVLEEVLEEKVVPAEWRDEFAKLFQRIMKKANTDTLLSKSIREREKM